MAKLMLIDFSLLSNQKLPNQVVKNSGIWLAINLVKTFNLSVYPVWIFLLSYRCALIETAYATLLKFFGVQNAGLFHLFILIITMGFTHVTSAVSILEYMPIDVKDISILLP